MAAKSGGELPGMPANDPLCVEVQQQLRDAASANAQKAMSVSPCGQKMYMEVGNGKRLSIPMDSLELDDRKLLKELDVDGNANVSLSELIQHSRSAKQTEKQAGYMQKIIIGMAGFIFILTGMMFAVSIIAIETTKEMRGQDNGVMQTPAGDVVRVASNDLTVSGDGQLVKNTGACPSTGRRLGDASFNDNTIKTTPSLTRFALASHLPDSMLMALDEFVVYSDKGHSLHIKVHGFARIPVLNSRCGNVVHFYTAWNGRITLDSTDLSFDAQTAAEFENAGFEIAVGGGTTRRLAGTSASDGFFKHLSGMEESGEWTCADVPLPQMSKTHSFKETLRSPCSNNDKMKDGPMLCDSEIGGFVFGASAISKTDYLSTLGKAQRMKQKLAGSSAEPIYAMTESTIMLSPKYRVQFDTYPVHPGQELVTLTNRETKESVEFQTYKGSRFRCANEAFNWVSNLEAAEASSDVDSDMHFEFMGIVEEDGQTLRHFRMMPDNAFLEYMGGQSATARPTDAYTEYWDVADTLSPYRILSGDGSLSKFSEYNNTLTDAQVTAALAARLPNIAFDALWACSSAEATNTTDTPEMQGPYSDLQPEGFDFYAAAMTDSDGEETPWEQVLADTEDTADKSEKVEFFRYLLRSRHPFAMPDFCYEMCKDALDAVKAEWNVGTDGTETDGCPSGALSSAMRCVQQSTVSRCSASAFVMHHMNDPCANMFQNEDGAEAGNAADRRLGSPAEASAEPVEKKSQVPYDNLKDGTKSIDLQHAPKDIQDAFTKHYGYEEGKPGRILFNVSDDAATSGIVEMGDKGAESRALFLGHACPKSLATRGRIQRLAYAWCIRWDWDNAITGEKFKLEIMWGLMSGYFGISITCQSCVEILSKVWYIPKPLEVNFCVGGNVAVSSAPSCPGIPITFSGKVYWAIDGSIDLGIVSITVARLEVGIQGGTVTYEKNCRWYSDDGRRRRRRWWGRRRRRASRVCDKVCDIRVGGYVRLQFGPGRATFEENYYVLNKVITVDVYVEVFEFWKLWWGGWWKAYSTRVITYYL